MLKTRKYLLLLASLIFLITMASGRVVSDLSFFYQLQLVAAFASITVTFLLVFLIFKEFFRKKIKNIFLRVTAWVPVLGFFAISYFVLLAMAWNSFDPRFDNDVSDIAIKGGRVHSHVFSGWRDVIKVYYETPLFLSFYYRKEICSRPGSEITFQRLNENTISCQGFEGTTEASF